jgi:hypothetical protein
MYAHFVTVRKQDVKRTGLSAMAALITIWGTAFGPGAAAEPAVEVNLASRTAWTFQPEEPNAQAKTLAVPAGGWRLNGFPTATAGTYERRIQIPKLPGGGPQITFVAFEAVNWEAVVSVGPDTDHLEEAGRHLSAWTPFRIDISRYVTPGASALLRVHVRDRNFFKDAEGHFTVPAATEWNDRQGRGILRGVALQVYPTTYIEDLFVKPSTPTNTLACTVTLHNASDQARTVSLSAALSAWNASARWNYPPLPAATLSLKPGERHTVTLGPVPWTPGRASWWWPNVPYRPDYHAQLHRLTLELRDGRYDPKMTKPPRLLQTENVRFGFCTPGQKGNVYTLNGVRVNLRGDSLPEGTIGTDAFARLPGFLPPTKTDPGWPGAVRNYQRLNVNVIRMHQVPCTRYMMDVCDALGMLVIPETAIRGARVKANLTALPDSYTTHLRELILRDRNHPSVFKWSLENELFGAPEAFLRRLYDTCKEADGTRPCSIDDNADYPNWPDFAVIEHYSQPPGTPDAAGGAPRTDRPFGQGEYIWPEGATPPGAVWWGLTTRSLREHANADTRPYTLIDVWPGVIPGLTPTNFPDPRLPPDSLEQGGRSLLHPPLPWQDSAIRLIQRSFAPVAVYDRAFDIACTPSNGKGEWPAILPMLPAGKTVTRQLIVFNDEFAGQTLQVRAQPVLRPDIKAPYALDKPLPPITRTISVPPGGHALVPLDLNVPQVARNTELSVTLSVWKENRKRYEEELRFVIVPEGRGGTTVRYEGRDDRTQGNWVTASGQRIYGMDAFLIPVPLGRSGFQMPEIMIQRGTGFDQTNPARSPTEGWTVQGDLMIYERPPRVTDPRVALHGPGMIEREAIAFLADAEPIRMRVDTTDGKPRLLSLYLLDYRRTKEAADVTIFDQYGHRLDSRRVTDYENGAYLRYRFTGSVLIQITSLTNSPATLSGIFVDPLPGDEPSRH